MSVARRGFRLAAKKFALTWPQIADTVTKEGILAILESKGDLKEYCICLEEHKTGEPHAHAYARYGEKLDTRNPHFFDVAGHHGNYQACKKPKNWIAYCMKDGDFIQNCLFKTWTNFRKEQADMTEWLQYRQALSLKEVTWPLTIFTMVQAEPTPSTKRCNYLVIGGPDTGKTRWVEATFTGVKVFKVRDHRYPFEGYSGERVIVWDDAWPKREDLIPASNVFGTKTLVGATRYTRTYWPCGVRRMLIILHNEEPSYSNDAWFTARFHKIYL